MRNYSFHLDIEFDQREKLENVLTEIKLLTNSLKVLGIYKGDTARLKTLNDITKNLNELDVELKKLVQSDYKSSNKKEKSKE